MNTSPPISKVSCLLAVLLLAFLGGCGSLTGLPGHGGGKRFAVEQELVAAATRGAIKQIDLSTLRGKKINLYVNAIGDTGTGSIVGGRFSVVSQLRGDYLQSPVTTEKSTFPRYTTTATSQNTSSTNSTTDTSSSTSEAEQTQSSGSSTSGSSTSPATTSTTSSTSGGLQKDNRTEGISSTSSTTNASGVTTTDSVLPYPDTKKTQQKGGGGVAQVGAEYKGIGSYQNSMEMANDDMKYLSALVQTYFFLQGVYIVPPSEAEIDVYVTVDIFGTIRTRIEWYFANNEILRAKTSFEIMAVDRISGRLVMPPQVAGAETEYNEQYILWAGPIIIKKTLSKSEPLLSDFTDVLDTGISPRSTEQNEPIPYPFRNEMKKMLKDKEKRPFE